jgi:hypothetical protein
VRKGPMPGGRVRVASTGHSPAPTRSSRSLTSVGID